MDLVCDLGTACTEWSTVSLLYTEWSTIGLVYTVWLDIGLFGIYSI